MPTSVPGWQRASTVSPTAKAPRLSAASSVAVRVIAACRKARGRPSTPVAFSSAVRVRPDRNGIRKT
eukprot:2712355-Prymnesium_polylepis.1